VIGADGRNSAVARGLGLDAALPWPRRTGLVAHYRGVRGLGQTGELHVFPGGYVGLAPLEDGLANVALVSDDAAIAARSAPIADYFAARLAATPLLATRLAGAERIGPIRGVGTMAHRARRVAGDGYLLVGDAAGFLDPFTGDGIYHALRGALLAAPVAAAALAAGDPSARALAPYLASRRRAFAAKRGVAWIVQTFIHSPALLGYVADRLDRRDELAQVLTGVVGDYRPAGHALSPLYLARLLRP
jgi:flavin-dependent dehydrogenase